MADRRSYFRVGLLLILGVVIAVGLLFFLGGPRIGQVTRIETYFSESVQGLDVGAQVKYRGVTLGRVLELGLANAEYGRAAENPESPVSYQLVFVRYEIDLGKVGPNVNMAEAVRIGLRARLAVQGLTGLSYIELDFVDPRQYGVGTVPWKPKFAVIPSMPSSLSQVQNSAQLILEKLNRVDLDRLVPAVQRLIDDLDEQITRGSVQQAASAASELMQQLRITVDRADLPGLTAELRETATAFRSIAQGKEVQAMLTNGVAVTDRLARIVAQLPTLLASLQSTARRADAGPPTCSNRWCRSCANCRSRSKICARRRI